MLTVGRESKKEIPVIAETWAVKISLAVLIIVLCVGCHKSHTSDAERGAAEHANKGTSSKPDSVDNGHVSAQSSSIAINREEIPLYRPGVLPDESMSIKQQLILLDLAGRLEKHPDIEAHLLGNLGPNEESSDTGPLQVISNAAAVKLGLNERVDPDFLNPQLTNKLDMDLKKRGISQGYSDNALYEFGWDIALDGRALIIGFAGHLRDLQDGMTLQDYMTRVVGWCHAIDYAKEHLVTYMTPYAISAVWSEAGWRTDVAVHTAYLIQDTSVPGRSGQAPYWNPKDNVVTWFTDPAEAAPAYMPVLVWKVRGLQENAGGGDAAVELNKIGSVFIKRFITCQYIVLEGSPPGSERAYAVTAPQLRRLSPKLATKENIIIVKLDSDGLVTTAFDPSLNPDAKNRISFKLMFDRPSWYPQYQPGL